MRKPCWISAVVFLSLLLLCLAVFAQLIPSGKGGNGTDTGTSSGYGINLWLSISLSNNAVDLLLHNTQPNVAYLIRSREDLASGAWFSEGTVTGAIAATTTPATISIGGRTNCLFLQAFAWMTNGTAETTPMLAIGGERIMELTTNGDVVSWGGNQFGEFGDYTHLDSTNPVHVVGLTNIIRIASGLNCSLALAANGALWAWGDNQTGQLGDGDTDSTNLPVPVLGMSNVVAIAANEMPDQTGDPLAVKADGTIWAWGGGLGSVPTQVVGISNAAAVSAGNEHSLALMNDGTVWAWGSNRAGQLGDGTWDDSDTPVQVSGLNNITAICTGSYFNLALASDGTVWAWGDNYYGQLGDGGMENDANQPVMVAGLTNVVGIAAGNIHSLALDDQGVLWAWGYDEYGQLGDGGVLYDVNQPIKVLAVTNVISIAAGPNASVALDANGNLWQWGGGNVGEWGDENGLPALAHPYADFYTGQLPNLTILNGNNQIAHAGLEFPQPLVFQVTDTNGVALSNAPVSVEVVAGDMELRTVSGGDNYKGLRLTTDINGEVSLIGYVDQDFSNPNCFVRVLAASHERIVEADFNETLVLPPTISITSPADGSIYLVETNQTLTITVDAEPAPGASIQEVDYYYGTNGVADTLLGNSTQRPYSFIWTNSLWWTNAFFGQYTLTAVAVDDAGAQSDPQSVTIKIILDSDGIGIPDYWQVQYFGQLLGQLGMDTNSSPDGNGQSLLYDYQNGFDPTDYYNGKLPTLEVLSGNDQAGSYDSFLPEPLIIGVAGANNAPVTFTVTNGTALLAMTTNDTPVASLALRTDTNGQILVWVYFPLASSNPPDSAIVASAVSGASSTAVTANEFIPLGHWTFNDTNTWVGEEGQLPLLTSNVIGIPSWSSNAVVVESSNPALLAYNVVETNGTTNINCQTGSGCSGSSRIGAAPMPEAMVPAPGADCSKWVVTIPPSPTAGGVCISVPMALNCCSAPPPTAVA
jgi:alpha-tubulin suppressor-like RCC1 family protein